ncbi:hypothetical protein [Poriferisphaera corsica]|uniref:hypothetical protein n=1 Tax=Poriferisphaera corsica TaxID=2528020 RepID=UPI0011A4C64A|nr:hypothetical protein [Poriferisphaera corsica]
MTFTDKFQPEGDESDHATHSTAVAYRHANESLYAVFYDEYVGNITRGDYVVNFRTYLSDLQIQKPRFAK